MNINYKVMFILRAQLKTKENGSDKHAYLKADSEYELDTIARGSLKDPKDSEFLATNKRFDFELKPNEQTKNDGAGIVAYNDKVGLFFNFWNFGSFETF